ncbi:MAG: YheC/YheD family protein [Syntrophomonadaceae bacterium]|nr:YheC/YheD family protein [Syntrophomonadaceae bacterium]
MKYPNNKVLIKIPPQLDKIFSQQTKLQIGQNQLSIQRLADKIIVDKSIKSDVIQISRQLLMHDNLNASSKVFHQLNYRLMPDKTIRVGPVVGILIAGKESAGSPPVARRARVYKELSQKAAAKNIFLYFFYADDFDWQHRLVKGFIYKSGSGKLHWHKAAFCLPDIVYNRISYRYKEETEAVQNFMSKARQASIYLFNSRFLNKWEVHKSLFNNLQTREFVLETDCYSAATLKKYLNKYNEFFIKPTASSVGKGIIKVIANQPGTIDYFQWGKSSNWQTCHSYGELFNRLSIPAGDKYILQKGIKLASIGKRVFDIRAQVQKDGQGKWQFTGAAVRLAAVGKFVTHVPNGGSKRDYHLTINEVFGSGPITEGLDKQLKNICRHVPQALEESLGINLAVLSIDIGIDRNGHMWIIEVNSKPASFDETAIHKRHLELLTDYFLFKTNFVIQ